MARKKTTITLSLTQDEYLALFEVAEELGYLWGERPSPSALIAAIARRDIQMIEKESYDGELASLRSQVAAIREILG